MRGARCGGFGGVSGEKLGAEFREVNFLGVGCFGLIFTEDHGASEVLDAFFDDVAKDFHHGY